MPSKKKENIRKKSGNIQIKKGNIRNNLILFFILTSAFIMRIIGIGDHAFVFDEAIYVKIVKDLSINGYDWQSMRMLGTAHPPIYFLLMTILYKNFYFANDETFFRIITVIISVIVTYFIYKLGCEYSKSTGSIASLFFSFNPYFIAYSRFATLDMLTVLFITVAIYFYSKYIYSDKIVYLMLAGASFGLAIFTKVYAGVFIFVIIIHLLIIKRQFIQIIQFIIPSVIVILLISLLLGQGIFFPWKILSTSYGWSVGQQIAFNWAPITVSTHIGFVSFVISMIGLGILIDMAIHKKHQLSSFYVLVFLLNIIIFTSYSGTHFARYFLILAPSLCIFFGYCSEKIIEKIKSQKKNLAFLSITILLIGLSSDYKSIANGSIYSATLIDDWWHIDSLKDAGKYISKNDTPYYISDDKDLSKGGEFFITNAHYPVLEAYSGMKGAFYMGNTLENINLFWLGYNNNALGIYPLDPMDEKNATYIVLVDKYTKLDSKYVLYFTDISYSWHTDDFIDEYLIYYELARKFNSQDGISSYVYKRNTNNTFALMQIPSIFIGEPADNWTKNNNGWIFGTAWTQAVNKKRDINNNGYAGITLTIPDHGNDSKLEVIFKDTGYDSLIIEGVFYDRNITLGKIELHNTNGTINKEINVPKQIYYDSDEFKQGIQQQFLILKNGNSSVVPVTRVSISKSIPSVLRS
jgi:hypothetical protein